MNEPQESDLTFSRVLTVHQRAIASEEDLTKLATERAVDPSVFGAYPPYFWSGTATNTTWDSYDTHMAPSSLKNYADDASRGVAFLRNHNTQQDATGQSLMGRFIGGQGNGVARMEADFYALPTPDDANYITKMKGGIVRDLSIGFYGGQWVCSICNRDMQEWFGPNACPHLLGMTYTPRDEAGTKAGDPVKARATIENAHLAEVSGVYDGSTPGAMIGKARALAVEGQLSTRRRELVEVRYRIHLPSAARSWPGSNALTGARQQVDQEGKEEQMPPGAETTEGTQPTTTQEEAATGQSPETEATTTTEQATPATRQQPDHLAGIRAALTGAGVQDVTDVAAAVRTLAEDNARLRPLADIGKQYRADLIEAAVTEGKRAHGNAFKEEQYRAILGRSDLEGIKLMRDDWATTAAETFKGGRQTTDGGEPQTEQGNGLRVLPPAAHRA